MRLKVFQIIVFCLISCINFAFAHCYQEAGKEYGIDPLLLKAIAYTESRLQENIESPTNDIGLMGINRWWLPTLKKRFSYTEEDVWNPCTNVKIGAWILSENYRVLGKNWNAVGAYAASCSKLKGQACINARTKYARTVYQHWLLLKKQSKPL